MKHSNTHCPLWTTASFGDSADTSPMDLASLCEHLMLCKRAQTRVHRAKHIANAVSQFFSARVVTTAVVVAAALSGVLWLAR